ncbi:formylglycine-generating enzyme family protein [Roseibium hamelinense]|nr:formylglycine-generating enzyme family protein [Roseibium hamelinense]
MLSGAFCLGLVSPAVMAQDMVAVGGFEIDRTEVTIGAFREFIEATGAVTAAEKAGGGEVYAAGWVQQPGWTWRTPFGRPATDQEPTVHVTFDEAQAYCAWRGKRLPTDAEWMEAAYTERRTSPPAPFETGQTYPYPTGKTPEGANCLQDCGATPALDHSAVLRRGVGHAPAGTTRAGVNGLYDMGANAWEWTDNGPGRQKTTRGGSWWYGAQQMHRDHSATKPADTAVVYIGFRCAKDS